MREISSEQAQNLMKQIKPIMDEKLIWFAYADNLPAAFFIVIPDINQIVKHLNGKFDTWAKIKFLLLKLKGTITRTKGIIFGVVPEHQGKGLESAIALQFRKAARDEPFYEYETMDMNWIGDFNPKMLRFTSKITQEVDKTYVTYRYLFDRNKIFERCPRVG
jgi:GNAT superfamily N-acetyltransferase